jgi:hypothetical protein
MQSVDYIITAKHYCAREGAKTVRERIKKLAEAIRRRNGVIFTHLDEIPRGFAVLAEIDFGQWIGRCGCGGAEFVDADEPVFFCFGCGNRENSGYLRPVFFPDDKAEIERLVLERPVDDVRGMDDLDRAAQARTLVFKQVVDVDGNQKLLALSRSWIPGESVEDLIEQNQAVYAWRASLANGGQ